MIQVIDPHDMKENTLVDKDIILMILLVGATVAAEKAGLAAWFLTPSQEDIIITVKMPKGYEDI